jgi:CreA protein
MASASSTSGAASSSLQLVRFFDKQRNVLVYVACSDRVIEGNPKNSISSVPVMSWPEP